MFKLKTKYLIPVLLYAIPNTLLSFGIVYIINNALSGNAMFLRNSMGISFTIIIVYTYLLNIIFQKALNKFTFHLLYENEKNIFGQILKAPLEKLEKFGPQRFFTAVEDLRTFSLLPYTVTHTVNSVLMLVLCLIYMFTLSFASALIVLVLILMVAGCYFVVVNSMSEKVTRLREFNEDYFKYVDDVMKGFKKLKLSFFRRENLMNRFLVPNRNEAGELHFNVSYVFLSINLISQYGLYFVIAVILFLLPSLGLLGREDVIAYVVIILFVSGPINNLINLQQSYTRFMVANRRINKFLADFEIVSIDKAPAQLLENDFETVAFENITFSYEQKAKEIPSENTFVMGPINLEIKKGETIFIVGGNGSGKSTFVNTLTGLYTPSAGVVKLNGSMQESPEERLQNLIAAVFTDNHIFSQNYEDFEIENNPEYAELVATMKLETVLKDYSEKAARRKFSKGQSKRMSLIFALLEKKPILILDEWAADQDPHFRKYFYEVLIPRLKEQGKTIIAVTHDDAYFHQADRVIKFDYGQIVKDINVSKKEELTADLWV